jgi:hypothetical protein
VAPPGIAIFYGGLAAEWWGSLEDGWRYDAVAVEGVALFACWAGAELGACFDFAGGELRRWISWLEGHSQRAVSVVASCDVTIAGAAFLATGRMDVLLLLILAGLLPLADLLYGRRVRRPR